MPPTAIRDRFVGLDITGCSLDSLRVEPGALVTMALHKVVPGEPVAKAYHLAFYWVCDSRIDLDVRFGVGRYGSTLGTITGHAAALDSPYLSDRVELEELATGQELDGQFLHFELEVSSGRVDIAAVDFSLHMVRLIPVHDHTGRDTPRDNA